MGPFDRFNDRAKRVLALAQDEAKRLDHDRICPEHLLLGLLREGEGAAAHVLGSLGIDLGRARRDVETTVHRGEEPPRDITLDDRTKRIIESAVHEARRLGSDHVGTEHLLLGFAAVTAEDTGGAAAKVIASLGVASDKLRHDVLAFLSSQRRESEPEASPGPAPTVRAAQGVTFRWPGPQDMSAFRDQQLADVRRVLAIGETKGIGDAALTLLSVELYADGAVAQLLLVDRTSGEPGVVPTPRLVVKLSDDRGTDYASRQHSGSGGGRRGAVQWRMAHAFAPAVPEGARALKLSIERVTWLAPGDTPPELVETAQTDGPWEWDIALA